MRWPVSVKGVVLDQGRVLLAHNDRDEWELPGGRLEPGERPEQCVVREIEEETGLDVRCGSLLDVHVLGVVPGRSVVVVSYGCVLVSDPTELRVSSEHDRVGFVAYDGLADLALPAGYRSAIEARRARGPMMEPW